MQDETTIKSTKTWSKNFGSCLAQTKLLEYGFTENRWSTAQTCFFTPLQSSCKNFGLGAAHPQVSLEAAIIHQWSPDLPPWKINSYPWKNGGWKTILPYWVLVTFQGQTVKFQAGSWLLLLRPGGEYWKWHLNALPAAVLQEPYQWPQRCKGGDETW